MKVMEIKATYRRPRRPLPKVTSPTELADVARKFYGRQIELQEIVIIIPMDVSGSALGVVELTKGNLTSSIADPKLVFSRVLMANATSFVLVHNHPSGSLKPSGADKNITNKLMEGAKILDINFIDHLIITKTSYFSFANEGLMN